MIDSLIPDVKKFLYLFYIITPEESLYKEVENVPTYLHDFLPWFFASITTEFFILAYKRQIAVNDLISSLSQGIFQDCVRILFKFTGGISVYIWVYENWRLVDIPWNSTTAWWSCLLAVDFLYYWYHRAAHEIHLLWAVHQVHHSSEEFNLSTALRQSIPQDFLMWISYIPIALFIPPPIYAVHVQFNLLYQFWIHSKFIKTLGPLEYIINTPSHHRVHHGRNRYCIDKNYAGVLIIWDRMFGTFEAQSDKIVYGLTHPINTFDPVKIQFGHLLYLWNAFWKAEGLKNKLFTVIKGPGWKPGKPWHGDPEDIPNVSHPVEKYNPQLDIWCCLYVLVHFFLIAVAYILLATHHKNYNYTTVMICIVYIIYSLTVFGAIMDKKSYAPFLELSRCLGFLLFGSFNVSTHLSLINLIFLLIWLFFLLSSMLWSIICLHISMPKAFIETYN